MSRFAHRASIVCLVLLICPDVVWAARPWLAGAGSYATYDMADLNDVIDEVNTVIAPDHLATLEDGPSWGVRLGLDTDPGVISLGYERLSGSTAVASDASMAEFDMPAHVFNLLLEQRIESDGRTRFGIGVGLGILRSAGAFRASAVDSSGAVRADISGTGPAFEIFATMDHWATDFLAVSPAVGYRLARVDHIDLENTYGYGLDGRGMSLDYSGFFVRLLVKVSVAMRE